MSNPTAFAIAGYILWMTFAALLIVITRTIMVMQSKRAPNNFDPTGSDVSPAAVRRARVHANSYESFGMVCGPMLVALATDTTAITNSLAYWMLGARLVQGSIHLISTHNVMTMMRAAAFAVQVSISIYWSFRLLMHFA